MKIVHIAPAAPYNDYWGYQENLLPKYQRKLGHEVTVLITNLEHQGNMTIETACRTYVLDDGVKIVRVARKKYKPGILTDILNRIDIYDWLVDIKPDFIFFHGLCSTTIYQVIKYRKKVNPDCVVVQDNHLDYQIGPICTSIRGWGKRFLYRWINKHSVKYVDRVYGVTPQRKEYAEDYFAIPKEKTDVLIMGADDEKIAFAKREQIRHDIRKQYQIADDTFLIVTGGKIDRKKNIHVLMEACKWFTNVKLLIFGEVMPDIQEEYAALMSQTNNIISIGWIDSDKVYDYYFAADLVMFPGQHSVLWEQACATKVPCVFKHWRGMEHVDNGGNSMLLEEVSAETLRDAVKSLLFTEKYQKMLQIARTDKTDVYLYSNIAKKSLECATITNKGFE